MEKGLSDIAGSKEPQEPTWTDIDSAVAEIGRLQQEVLYNRRFYTLGKKEERLHELESVNAELLKALEGIAWVSIDKDNMEFKALITCWQLDKLRAAIKEAKS